MTMMARKTGDSAPTKTQIQKRVIPNQVISCLLLW
jgi:hypothetical protein